MIVKLLTEYHLEFLSLKEGCTGSSESTLVKMPHCWKSHVTAHLSRSAYLSALDCFLMSSFITPNLSALFFNLYNYNKHKHKEQHFQLYI